MKFHILVLILVMLLTGPFFVSLLMGTYPVPVGTVWGIFWSGITEFTPYWDPTVEKVTFQVRIPRMLPRILVSDGLTISRTFCQTLSKSPMVSPDILGVSTGTGLGAVLVTLGSGSWAQIQLNALVFGLAAVAAAYLIGSVCGKAEATTLVLTGVTVSGPFRAFLSVVKTYADTDSQFPSITFWLIGSLGKGDMEDVGIPLPVTGVCLLILFLYQNQIDVLTTGEEEAVALGVNVRLVDFLVIVTSTMMAVVSVSICGMIGWVGLVVPHITRLFTGARYSRLIAVSFFIGGFFLLLMDDTIRGVSSVELLLGILTALVGTPVPTFLLVRPRKGASQC